MSQRISQWWCLIPLFAASVWLWVTINDDQTRKLFFGLWRTRDVLVACGLIYLGLLALSFTTSRRTGFGFVLGTLTACLSVGLLEILGLVGIINYPKIFNRRGQAVLGQQAVPGLDVRGETYEDLALRFGLPTHPIPFHYVTDRRGFRNRQDLAEADMYLVGDSILVAGLIPIEQTMTSILAERLGVRTMNIALIGLSPQEERDLFLAADLPTTERLVIQFVFEGNDLLDSAAYRQPQGSGEPIAKSTLSYNITTWLQRRTDFRKLVDERKVGQIGGQDYLFFWTDQSFRGVEHEFEYVCEALRDMHTRVTEEGGHFAVVFMPAKVRVLGPFCNWPAESSIRDYTSHISPLRSWLTDWCHEQGISMLDLTDPLIGSTQEGAIPWFATDTHPNEIGHRVIADTIENWNVVTTWMDARPNNGVVGEVRGEARVNLAQE